MTLRRLWAAVPLAVLVAVLAHVAGFGFNHAPGGENALGLGVALLAGIVLLLGRGFFAAAAGPAGIPAGTTRGNDCSAIGLAALAAGAFAAIELAEGHLSLLGSLRPLVAMLPIAVAVAALARRAQRAVSRAGVRFAAGTRPGARARGAVFVAWVSHRGSARSIARRGARLGRAPPRFA